MPTLLRLRFKSSLLLLSLLLCACTQKRPLYVNGINAYVHQISKKYEYIIIYQITMPKKVKFKISSLKVTYHTKLKLDTTSSLLKQARYTSVLAPKNSQQSRLTYYYFHSDHALTKAQKKMIEKTKCTYEYLDRKETKQVQHVYYQ